MQQGVATTLPTGNSKRDSGQGKAMDFMMVIPKGEGEREPRGSIYPE